MSQEDSKIAEKYEESQKPTKFNSDELKNLFNKVIL